MKMTCPSPSGMLVLGKSTPYNWTRQKSDSEACADQSLGESNLVRISKYDVVGEQPVVVVSISMNQ